VKKSGTFLNSRPQKRNIILVNLLCKIQASTRLIKDKKRRIIPRGNQAKTRRNRDGKFTKKNNKTFFGYKIHSQQEIKTQLILNFQLTAANIHDIKINLCQIDEVDYKDRGYFKRKYRQYNGSMTRSVRDHPLIIWEKLRNKRISRKRAPVERFYSLLDRINNNHTKLTTTERNLVQVTILAMIFNIEQLINLQKPKKIKSAKEENESEKIDPSIPFKFFNNSTLYYNNYNIINFLISTSINKKIKTLKKGSTKRNPNITLSMSKSDYRRRNKRKLGKIRKQKNQKIQKEYKKLITSLNEFSLTKPHL